MDLTLENLTLAYPDGDTTLTAVDDVCLTIPSGTRTALVGPSGSGKSSLLAVAGGLTRPTAGRVLLGDEVIFTADTPARAATRIRLHRIGFVFQTPQLLASLTALEQVELPAYLQGRRRADVRAKAQELLDAVGVGGLAQRRPAQLSGGQRQRVAIARALIGSPDLLLVDEPTSALDHERGKAIIELITTLGADLGAATLIVSHDLSTLGSVDSTVAMNDGRLTAAVSV